MPLGRLGEIRRRTRVRVLVRQFGIAELALDYGSSRRGVRQRGVQLRLPTRQHLRRRGNIRVPLASRLLERGHRVDEQLFDPSPLLHLRVVLCLEISETFGQRGQLGGVFLICILASRLGLRQVLLLVVELLLLSFDP